MRKMIRLVKARASVFLVFAFVVWTAWLAGMALGAFPVGDQVLVLFNAALIIAAVLFLLFRHQIERYLVLFLFASGWLFFHCVALIKCALVNQELLTAGSADIWSISLQVAADQLIDLVFFGIPATLGFHLSTIDRHSLFGGIVLVSVKFVLIVITAVSLFDYLRMFLSVSLSRRPLRSTALGVRYTCP